MNPLPTPIEVFDALVTLLGPQTFYSTVGERGEGIALLLDQAVKKAFVQSLTGMPVEVIRTVVALPHFSFGGRPDYRYHVPHAQYVCKRCSRALFQNVEECDPGRILVCSCGEFMDLLQIEFRFRDSPVEYRPVWWGGWRVKWEDRVKPR